MAELFEPAPPLKGADQRLVEAYTEAGRTLDDLPYTEDFERLYQAIGAEYSGRSRQDVLRRLHNLRKAGRLTRLGRAPTPAPRVSTDEEALIRALVIERVGTLGQRDQLPYDPRLDGLTEAFNAQTGRTLVRHDIWRLIAKIAK